MVRANLGRGLVIVVGIVLVLVAMVALNMPDHTTGHGQPTVAAADTTDGGTSS